MDQPSTSDHPGAFPTTRWSVVSAVKGTETDAQRALGELCELYWYPLYAYTRRTGRGHSESQDITQGFFLKLLKSDLFRQARQARGKLRNFLLTALKHYLTDLHRAETAQKRGGGIPPISIDEELAEKRYRNEPNHRLTPDLVFERRWAASLFDNALGQLREEFAANQKLPIFENLVSFIPWNSGGDPQQVAQELGITLPAVRLHLHHLRERYRKIFYQHVADTVQNDEDVPDEIGYLRTLFGSPSPSPD